MALPDVADYAPEFYVEQVECALRARREMPWGSQIPDREWRHFVLPVRVNNEHLDTFRTTCYAELRDRVRGLSMYEAVLEVNHWCHEHVTYQPSDSRTSPPLSSMRSAIGRCGEESTYTVAALRAVGIPARQVYTPRWAHTDDNHAWVEAWVDGKWYFLGACEPEPVLNLGWFNAPASRGMLMHTKVFGRYDGPEDVMSRTNCFTEINVTDGYARTAPATVEVVGTDGKPAAGVRIDFKVYNYAELYTVLSTKTDNQGRARITAGIGDLVAWASDGTHFGLAKITPGTQDVTTLRLAHKAGERFDLGKKMSNEQLIDTIISDLMQARDYLKKDPLYCNKTYSNRYMAYDRTQRMNYYAAIALLARMEIYRQHYAEAARYAQEVLDSEMPRATYTLGCTVLPV